ncbi:MAG: ribosome biogenesis GTP-binding protein YihA/YsxC [Desulfobacterales bacterium]|nr:ribosome biogenesis GTP-binding protein YihA/YsxC [Desulfobacterales bacterium]
MIIKSAEFVTSAVKPSQYPPADIPEIAFAGRSNVGKSSLINTLVNRKRLVKTSTTPGRTQLVNFFMVNGAFAFVDLPGYGYARVPVSIKKTWGPMIETYLKDRENLKGVVLLIDIRRVPRQEEKTFMDWLSHYNIPPVLVLTKADKLSKSKQAQQRVVIAETLGVDTNGLIPFSTKTRMGRTAAWEAIEGLL